MRYIHLNPVRGGIAVDLKGLDRFAYGGHGPLMGHPQRRWQDTGPILQRFERTIRAARRKYRQFVEKGLKLGRQPELTGGGLIRSQSGWSAVKALRLSKAYLNGDERILGDSEFVERVLREAGEKLKRKHRARALGLGLASVAQRVAEVTGVSEDQVCAAGQHRQTVQARSLLC